MLHSYPESFVSVLPALLTIGLAMYTHRVLLSIGVGALLGALLLCDFNAFFAAGYLKESLLGHFFGQDGLQWGKFGILAFLFLMGILIEMLGQTGATDAFAGWIASRVRSRRGAKWIISLMALIFFIDDYFHALAAGNVGRPIADRYGLSRAKLAYLLDSTAAPLCVATPVSSWGAYIIALLAGIFTTQQITGHSALGAFLTMIPMIYYTLFTFMTIGLVCAFDLNVGPMRRSERRARAEQAQSEQEPVASGSPWPLIVPLTVCTLVAIGMILYTGAQGLERFSVIAALESAQMEVSLVAGALVALATLLPSVVRLGLPAKGLLRHCFLGARSMWPAVSVLIFAWTIGAVVTDLGTGHYLASLSNAHVPAFLLPALVFVLAGFMAFSTGTSWGTFGIMLPLAASIAMEGDPSLLLPLMAAVLSGAVFGDHCSPISDTTILSASGAGCHHMTHVVTQLPYAVASASITALAYLILGLTGSVLLGLGAGLAIYSSAALILWLQSRRKSTSLTHQLNPA